MLRSEANLDMVWGHRASTSQGASWHCRAGKLGARVVNDRALTRGAWRRRWASLPLLVAVVALSACAALPVRSSDATSPQDQDTDRLYAEEDVTARGWESGLGADVDSFCDGLPDAAVVEAITGWDDLESGVLTMNGYAACSLGNGVGTKPSNERDTIVLSLAVASDQGPGGALAAMDEQGYEIITPSSVVDSGFEAWAQGFIVHVIWGEDGGAMYDLYVRPADGSGLGDDDVRRIASDFLAAWGN